MLKKYRQYLKHIRATGNKTASMVFGISLVVLIIALGTLAVFWPEERSFALGMGAMGLVVFASIHISGFIQYLKSNNEDD